MGDAARATLETDIETLLERAAMRVVQLRDGDEDEDAGASGCYA